MSPANHEIEAKFAVPSHQAVSDAIRRAGGVYLGSFIQTDCFYDSPDGRLKGGDCGLRIRRTRRLTPAGVAGDVLPQVTFKGPRRKDSRAKSRPEYQSHLDNPEAMEMLFDAVGLTARVAIEKRRTSYRVDACMVELDELPGLGCFVEVEGPDEAAVFDVCERLGLTGEPIRESYVGMLTRHGNLRPGDKVTFDLP